MAKNNAAPTRQELLDRVAELEEETGTSPTSLTRSPIS
jgi:hypothetical protein